MKYNQEDEKCECETSLHTTPNSKCIFKDGDEFKPLETSLV